MVEIRQQRLKMIDVRLCEVSDLWNFDMTSAKVLWLHFHCIRHFTFQKPTQTQAWQSLTTFLELLIFE